MTSVLQSLSDGAAQVVESSGSSVVRVEGRRRMAASGVVWSADGLVVTSNHVVERDDNLHVGLPDGATVDATVIGRDPSTDLVLLRASAAGLAPATWLDAGELKVGSLVFALGRPGSSVQASLGVVSALGEAWRTGAGGEMDRYVQCDLVMYPGFSGGPLLEAGGKFAGLNSSALARGVSVSIPAATVRRVVETLISHGQVPRGYLGVGVQPVRLPDSLAAAAGQETGLMVMSVEPDGPAGKAGLLQGDVLLTLDGLSTQNLDDLQASMQGERVGKSVQVRIVRSGAVQEHALTIGKR